MPYVQIGTRKPVDGWYTTQAFLWAHDMDLRMWLPSLTWYDNARSTSGLHYTFTFGFGTEESRAKALLMFTTTMEYFKRQDQ